MQADLLKAAVSEITDLDMDVVFHESIDSTNSWSLLQCKSGKILPFACFADEQTSGRGRRGKQWLMPAGSNIAMSLTWPFALSHQQLSLLPLSIAIAIAEVLESLQLQQVKIKWPNDVYVRSRKIAGILIETRPIKEYQVAARLSSMRYVAVTIGVGLNYDMSALKRDESRACVLPAFTDICEQHSLQLAGLKPERNVVALALLQRVIAVCRNYQEDARQYLEKFRSEYDYCKDKKVEIVLEDGQTLSGVAQGVSDDAELQVLVAGKQYVFNSAEVSVKTGSKHLASENDSNS